MALIRVEGVGDLLSVHVRGDSFHRLCQLHEEVEFSRDATFCLQSGEPGKHVCHLSSLEALEFLHHQAHQLHIALVRCEWSILYHRVRTARAPLLPRKLGDARDGGGYVYEVERLVVLIHNVENRLGAAGLRDVAVQLLVRDAS